MRELTRRGEQLRDGRPLLVTQFDHNDAVRGEQCGRTFGQPTISGKPVLIRQQCPERFMIPHGARQRFQLRGRHIRRIRDDHVEAALGQHFGRKGEPIGLDESNPLVHLMATHIPRRDLEGLG